MSDPMSNREIEDVLSSIRRLVAREAARPAPERPAPDRLVLTEAQRIAVNESHPPAAESASPGGDRPQAGAVVSRADAPVAAPPAAPEPDARSDAGSRGDDDARAAPFPPLSAATGAEGDASRAAAPTLASLSPRRPAPDQPASADVEDADDDGLQARPSWRAPDDAMAPADAAAEDDGQQDNDGPGPGLDDPTGNMAEEGDAPGPATARGPGAGDAVAVDPESEAGPADDDDHDDEDEDDGSALAETLIDEEMLRALVAQLVREELRGQLGERITMQVRKLVRAEVARALEEREYL